MVRSMGGDLGGDWGEQSLQKFEVGDSPCIRPPHIWRSSVKGCTEKVQSDKKR